MRRRTSIATAAALIAATLGASVVGTTGATAAAPSAERLHGSFVFSAVALYSGKTNHYGVGAPSSTTLVPVGYGASSAAAAATATDWSFPAMGETGPLSPESDADQCLGDPGGNALVMGSCSGASAQQWRWVDVPLGKGLQNVATGEWLGTAAEGTDDSLQASSNPARYTAAVEVERLTGGGTPPPAEGSRLTGKIVFSQAGASTPGLFWWAVGDADSNGRGRAKSGADAAGAAAAGTTWTTPARGGSGPLSPASDPDECLDGNRNSAIYVVVACDGGTYQQWKWVDVGTGKGLQNEGDPLKYVGTGNSGGFDDYLEGGAVYQGRANGQIDTSFLTGGGTVTPPTPENGGIDGDGLGFPATIAAGGRGTAHVGLRVTDDLTALRATEIELQAPAGTTFDRSQTHLDAELRSGPTAAWTAHAGLRIDGSVTADGQTFRGTIADAGSTFRAPAGTELRWGISVVADAPMR